MTIHTCGHCRPFSLCFKLATLLAASVFVFLSSLGTAISQEKTVTIAAWADYIPPEVISGFEARTGIKVVYDTFDSLEFLETKLLTGGSGYDLVLPSALVANRLIQAGALQELDKAQFGNYANLDPDILAFLAKHDEGNKYGVPYLWGTTGILYNPKLVSERLENAPVGSLDILFDPEIAAHFADCGIAMIDSPEEVVAIALNYLGLDPFTADAAVLEQAEALLTSVRPHIRHFRTGAIINGLADGDLCLVLGWSGDAGLAHARAIDAGNGIEIAYAIPREGTEVFFDFLSIPVDAPNPENAHRFIDYLMEPEAIAEVTNQYFYPNGNKAAFELVAEEVKNDPSVYPPSEIMEKLFPNLPREHGALRLLTRSWTRFKSGS
ncbi:polyamine ABC transporter substrate-binding protein [Roseibium sp.]|uniref:polyamine ABC transporter substrate-binding protein n=1 Tax=Roseibium sp. TaxID=1936156 RepID=UPI003B500867